jgi:hypothetical protein
MTELFWMAASRDRRYKKPVFKRKGNAERYARRKSTDRNCFFVYPLWRTIFRISDEEFAQLAKCPS